MKSATIKIICIMVALLGVKEALSQNRVEAKIVHLKNDKGVCRVCLFNNAASFKGESGEPFKCLSVPVKNQMAYAQFNNLPDGTYALFVFHDENYNNKIDKNFLGIPKEGYGASMNKLPFAGAPTFSDNQFNIHGNSIKRLEIKIRNL